MSLINDALKRAKQAQARHAPLPPLPEAPLVPVVHSPDSATMTRLLASGAAVLGLLSFFFLALWWRGSSRLARAEGLHEKTARAIVVPPGETKTNRQPITSTPPVVRLSDANSNGAPVAVATALTNPPTPPTPLPPPSIASVTQAPVVSAAAAPLTNKTAMTVVPPPPPPAPAAAPSLETPLDQAANEALVAKLKLQGIFYRGVKSSAIINGQTVFLGDEIEGAKVVAIQRQLVKLLIGLHTNTLSLR
jgi:hypothetical protein